MGIESDVIWFDGELVPFAQANVHVLSHSLHYGMGAFEGIRAYEQPDGRPGIWRLDAHMRRLLDSVRMVRWTPTVSGAQIRQGCLDVLEANRFKAAYIRPLIFAGMGSMGIGARNNPIHTIIAAWDWGAYMGEEGVKNGVRIKTSSFVRQHPNAALQRAKLVGHYVNSILARYEANDDGYDEALILDHQGHVAEGSGENIFFARDGVVYTPSEINVLPGVTRASVMDILRHEGIEVREALFGRDALYCADEVFMTGTAAEITPVREIDRRPVGDGKAGPLTRKVQAIYGDAVRGRIDWLSAGIAQP